MLEVSLGAGEMFHVTASVNRGSIERQGLDWARMGAAFGIAGSRGPELEAVFLCESRFDVDSYLRMARTFCDVWAVDVTGYWLENGPHGWVIAARSIPAGRLRLVEADVALDDDDPHHASGVPADRPALAPVSLQTEDGYGWGDNDGVIVINPPDGPARPPEQAPTGIAQPQQI